MKGSGFRVYSKVEGLKGGLKGVGFKGLGLGSRVEGFKGFRIVGLRISG